MSRGVNWSRRFGLRRKAEDPFADVREAEPAEPKPPEWSKKDMLAVMIAMFQLFMPLMIGLVLVGVLVMLLLR